jgi:transposase-like protein
MNRLDRKTRAQVISCLIEGCSIRSTVRMTGVAKKTVMRLLLEVGEICVDYQDQVFRNLQTQRLELVFY